MSVHNLYKAVCTVFKDQINFSSTRILRCWSHHNTDDWLHFPMPLLLLPSVPTCNVPTYYITIYDDKPIVSPFDSIHNYMIMYTLITNDGGEEATSSQIQGAFKYNAHILLHFPCVTTLISSHITQILSHSWVLVSGWGAKPVFSSNLVFFKQMKFEEYGKNKQNIPRG